MLWHERRRGLITGFMRRATAERLNSRASQVRLFRQLLIPNAFLLPPHSFAPIEAAWDSTRRFGWYCPGLRILDSFGRLGFARRAGVICIFALEQAPVYPQCPLGRGSCAEG